jgi:hypothetical protein
MPKKVFHNDFLKQSLLALIANPPLKISVLCWSFIIAIKCLIPAKTNPNSLAQRLNAFRREYFEDNGIRLRQVSIVTAIRLS